MGDCLDVYACSTDAIVTRGCTRPEACLTENSFRGCALGQDYLTHIPVDVDCSAFGLVCMDGLGSPICCLPSPEDPPEGVVCDGDGGWICNREMMFGFECSNIGATCYSGELADGYSYCIGRGDACEMPYQMHYQKACEGSLETNCVSGREARRDCRRSWQICKDFETWGECGFPGCDSDPEGDTCVGDSIRYCGVHGWTTVNCKDLGLSTCGNRGEYEIASCLE